jgi:hypothetical protein
MSRCVCGGPLLAPLLALLVTLLLTGVACAPPPRMCTGAGDCGGASSCVAGRCVTRGGVVAISTAQRRLYDPVAVGFVRRGGDAPRPATVALGQGDGGTAFLRFAVALPPEASVLEAYLLLDRVADLDPAPAPIALHAALVASAWDERSLSWASQPLVQEMGSPVTWVLPAGGPVVRIDVRTLVERWRRRGGPEFGLAVVSDGVPDGGKSANGPAGAPGTGPAIGRGLAFALAPQDGRRESGESDPTSVRAGLSREPAWALAPRLELYLK